MIPLPIRQFGFLFSFAVVSLLPLARGATEHRDERVVGMTTRSYVDAERSNWPGTGERPVRVTIWYPGEGSETTGSIVSSDGADQQATVHREVHLAMASQRRPLILLSHGSGGRAVQMAWLGHAIARHGMVAAAVDHNGTDEEECHRKRPTLTDFFAWERPRDVSVALTHILEDDVFSGAIDARRIGAAGFSLGGTTALWLAGARLDLEALRRNSPPPPPAIADAIESLVEYSKVDPVAIASVGRAGRSFRDSRIGAVVALAPPMGAGFTPDGLAAAVVPALIVVGDADVIAPADTNARHFAAGMPHARLVVVPGERGHYTRPLPEAQLDTEMREVAEMAIRFFEEQWYHR